MNALTFINEQLTALGVPYEFGEWTQDIQYPYFVGELPSPEEIDTENGKEETSFILTGFHRGAKIDLENIRQRIKEHFYFGAKTMVGNEAIIVHYDGGHYIPSGEADLQKLQINFTIKEWKVY